VPNHVSRLEEIYEELLGARSLADEVHAAV
jgi:hypothetical protein